MNETELSVILKERLSKLTFDIVDEDLTAIDTNYRTYKSVNLNWVASPPERIRWIDSNAIENSVLPSEYSVDVTNGRITFTTARNNSDVVRADYSFFPFTDAQLLSITQAARKQVQVLIWREIDWNIIHANYQEAVLKKCYTIALRELQFPTIKYFSISIAGRSISKENQVTMIGTLIDSNEKELLSDINALRYFDKTNILS